MSLQFDGVARFRRLVLSTASGLFDLLLRHFLRLNAGRRSKKTAASQSRPVYLAARRLVRYRN